MVKPWQFHVKCNYPPNHSSGQCHINMNDNKSVNKSLSATDSNHPTLSFKGLRGALKNAVFRGLIVDASHEIFVQNHSNFDIECQMG